MATKIEKRKWSSGDESGTLRGKDFFVAYLVRMTQFEKFHFPHCGRSWTAHGSRLAEIPYSLSLAPSTSHVCCDADLFLPFSFGGASEEIIGR